MGIVVFDFDKTLTFNDTMNQMFLWRMRGWRFFYLPYYCSLLLLVKLKVLSVKRQKELCLYMLFSNKKDCVIQECERFSKHIKLSPIMNKLNEEMEKGSEIIILSASPIYYLRILFPKVEVIGTTFLFDHNGEFCGLGEHPYGKEKIRALRSRGIMHIRKMYYDSKSDEKLFEICDIAYKVNKGKIIKIIKIIQ